MIVSSSWLMTTSIYPSISAHASSMRRLSISLRLCHFCPAASRPSPNSTLWAPVIRTDNRLSGSDLEVWICSLFSIQESHFYRYTFQCSLPAAPRLSIPLSLPAAAGIPWFDSSMVYSIKATFYGPLVVVALDFQYWIYAWAFRVALPFYPRLQLYSSSSIAALLATFFVVPFLLLQR